MTVVDPAPLLAWERTPAEQILCWWMTVARRPVATKRLPVTPLIPMLLMHAIERTSKGTNDCQKLSSIFSKKLHTTPRTPPESESSRSLPKVLPSAQILMQTSNCVVLKSHSQSRSKAMEIPGGCSIRCADPVSRSMARLSPWSIS